MARLITAQKILFLENAIKDLPKGSICTEKQLMKLRDFVNFGCLVYSQWWATCTNAVDAPYHDLQLY